jgi:hypothetical protein
VQAVKTFCSNDIRERAFVIERRRGEREESINLAVVGE